MVPDTYIFDIEVFKYDWLIVFKDIETGAYYKIWNNNEAVTEFMEQDPFLGGFNNKHYDNHILKGILIGCTPEQIKSINDQIIKKEINGWDVPELQGYRVFFHSFDLMDDCQQGTSLKMIEAHLGIPIEETEVDFDIDRPLTQEERRLTERYCMYDVDATEILYKLRKGYISNKENLARACGLDSRNGIYMTNAKMTSTYLQARRPDKPWTDGRDYVYPDKLLMEYIPQEVIDFYDRFRDKSIQDEEVFNSSLKIMVGECPVTLGLGGIHGAIPNYLEEATEIRSIRNKDVASYYPHLIVIPLSYGQKYGYCSRAIPDPQIYVNVLEERVAAKKRGDKSLADALKLVLNTTYGVMLNGYKDVAYNDLYDPLMGRSVCITGQLLLLELSNHLLAECPTLKIIQLNTDGIMVSFDNSDEAKWQKITQEWQDRTGFELEEDFIKKIIQRDVNNYIEIPADGGKPKVKGGVLVRGVLTNGKFDFSELGLPTWECISGGAFKINNDATVISSAIQAYFINGTPVEEYIENDNEILHYQLIAKAGAKYKACFQMIGDEAYPMQKVNRVYAVEDYNAGTLYKTHAVTGRDSKIPGLPMHCIVDNSNRLDISVVDKSWYVREAKRHIREFRGEKGVKRNTRKINMLKKEALEIIGG